METLVLSPVFASVATAALVIITWLLLSLRQYASGSTPGTVGYPLIGDTIGFIRAQTKDDLTTFFKEKAAKYGPYFKMSVFGDTVVVMDPPAGHKFFFSNEDKLFRTYWGPPYARLLGADSVALKCGESHKIARRHLVSTFLGLDTVWGFVPKVEALALQHLDEHWKEDTTICSFKMMKKLTFALICELCMSITAKKEVEALLDAFEPWVDGLLQIPINLPGFKYHRALNARMALHRLLEGYILRRKEELRDGRANSTQDLLSALLTQPDEAGHLYTNSEIKDNIQFLLAAGYATTSSVLTLVIRNAAKNPEVYEALIQEHARIAASRGEHGLLTVQHLRSMEYTWRVAQETMRVTPVVNVGMRIAMKDFQYNGYNIPKGWMLLWSQNRCSGDETFFENPDKFDPTRFDRNTPAPYTYLPFGAGPRACPGNEFAKMEILVFMHYLLQSYKWSLVDPKEPMERRMIPMTSRGSLLKVTKFKAF